jgi:hypothetical protein
MTGTVNVTAQNFGAAGYLDISVVQGGVASAYVDGNPDGLDVEVTAQRLLFRDDVTNPPRYIDFDLSTIGGLDASQLVYQFQSNGGFTQMRVREYSVLDGWNTVVDWSTFPWGNEDPSALYAATTTASMASVEFPISIPTIAAAVVGAGAAVVLLSFGVFVGFMLVRKLFYRTLASVGRARERRHQVNRNRDTAAILANLGTHGGRSS